MRRSGCAGANEVLARLEALSGLHADGVLTDEEFRVAKARLIDEL